MKYLFISMVLLVILCVGSYIGMTICGQETIVPHWFVIIAYTIILNAYISVVSFLIKLVLGKD